MASVSVCIPFRPVDEQRVANLERAMQTWDEVGWPVYLGDHEGESFSRGEAINAAVAKTDTEVVIVADCDFIIGNAHMARQGVEAALRYDAYVVCYSVMHCLNQEGTDRMRAHQSINPRRHYLESLALIWGNCFAIPRTLFDRVCGFDDRFRGWGAEDIAFLVSASTMGGPKQRIPGEAWHMTHPSNEDREFLPENNALASRYRGADGDREAMALILAERGCNGG